MIRGFWRILVCFFFLIKKNLLSVLCHKVKIASSRIIALKFSLYHRAALEDISHTSFFGEFNDAL